MMYTLGHDFVPAGIHAGGLRYHGDSPLVSMLYNNGDIEAVAVHQIACFDAAVQFARAEGILPAPESSHAIRVAIDEALAAKEAGEDKTCCSTSPATVTSTWPPTRPTTPASCRTTTSPPGHTSRTDR